MTEPCQPASVCRAYIDGHCHLADSRFDGILEDVLRRSEDAGIRAWIQGGVDPEDWERQKKLREKFGERIIPVFGLHPWWVAHSGVERLEEALKQLERDLPAAAALGELGLDFGPRVPEVSPGGSRSRQIEAFEAQLGIARKHGKPIVLHIVRAHEEALSVLRGGGVPWAGGIVHSFSADRERMREYLDLGLMISVGGVITREGHKKVKEAVAAIPSDRLVLETDSPDQSPSGWGGGSIAHSGRALNEPANLLRVAQVVAALRNEKAPLVLERSAANLIRLFGLMPNS